MSVILFCFHFFKCIDWGAQAKDWAIRSTSVYKAMKPKILKTDPIEPIKNLLLPQCFQCSLQAHQRHSALLRARNFANFLFNFGFCLLSNVFQSKVSGELVFWNNSTLCSNLAQFLNYFGKNLPTNFQKEATFSSLFSIFSYPVSIVWKSVRLRVKYFEACFISELAILA